MSNDVSLDINQESNPVQTVAPPKEDNNMLRATDKITALYCRLSVRTTIHRLTRKRVIENSADALSYFPVRDMPANMQVTAKQIRYNGTIGFEYDLNFK